MTLAIGDGANDVAMIREAHVGVAILGKEGRQAARSSDYAFGKFKFLARLILVHGHYSYYRISYTVLYFFYKNVVVMVPLILYGVVSLYSGEPAYVSKGKDTRACNERRTPHLPPQAGSSSLTALVPSLVRPHAHAYG